MSNIQKSLTISIVKAYNWNQQLHQTIFQLSFSSLLSGSLILRKTIQPQCSNNQLIINTSLRITYTTDQSQILLHIQKKLQPQPPIFIEEFLIDLELLAEKKVQYLPFSKNDKILQVACGVIPREIKEQRKSVKKDTRLDKFITQKQGFLKSFVSQSRQKIEQDQQRTGFSQKLFGLLQETKRLRQKICNKKYNKINEQLIQSNEISQFNKQQDKNITQMSDNNQKLIKSQSQNLLNVPKQNIIQNKRNKRQINNKGYIKSIYKLDIRNLNIINSILSQKSKSQPIEHQDQVLRSKQQQIYTFQSNNNYFK